MVGGEPLRHETPMTPLEYAGPQSVKPPSIWLWRFAFWPAVLAGFFGVAILALYALTAYDGLAMAGFWWLLIGGVLTAVAFIVGVIYALTSQLRRFPPPASRRRALYAVLLPILNVPLAIFCFYAGTQLMEHNAHSLIIRNDGAERIDEIRLASPSFSRTIGPLKPGGRTRVRYPRLPRETLTMEVRIGEQRVPYVVTDSMTADSMHGPRHIELNGLTGYTNHLDSSP